MSAALAFEQVPSFEHQFFVPNLTRHVRSVSQYNSVSQYQHVLGLALDDDFGCNDSSADFSIEPNQNSVGFDLTVQLTLNDDVTGQFDGAIQGDRCGQDQGLIVGRSKVERRCERYVHCYTI